MDLDDYFDRLDDELENEDGFEDEEESDFETMSEEDEDAMTGNGVLSGFIRAFTSGGGR